MADERTAGGRTGEWADGPTGGRADETDGRTWPAADPLCAFKKAPIDAMASSEWLSDFSSLGFLLGIKLS